MNKLLVYLLTLSLFSCEKLCSVTSVLCKNKVEQTPPIDFTQIDLFPTFNDCKSKLSYEESNACFRTTLHKKLGEQIGTLKLTTENYVTDTLLINFSISKNGKFKCERIKINSELTAALPYLKDDIEDIVNNLGSISPAQKRGIPVTSMFTIPLVIETE
ncbi:hypothetical protein ACXGQW_06880 [Wenyingzhuangia sp. IMCC45533]